MDCAGAQSYRLQVLWTCSHQFTGFDNGSLIGPIAYKSALFSVLLISAYLLEEVIVGAFHGKGPAESFPRVGDGTVWGILAMAFVLCLALVPFFAFREMARVLGPANFRALILKGAATSNQSQFSTTVGTR
jgi:hypothetical protein